MRLVANVGGDVRSDVCERVECAERQVSEESTDDHKKAAKDEQFCRPFTQC